MATAKFNTVIETPKTGSVDNGYDLGTVLTLEGFNGSVAYTLISEVAGTYLERSTLYVEPGSYGEIIIEVSEIKGGTATARATTKITGFYAKVAETLNKPSYQTALTNTRDNWSTIVEVPK